MFPSKALLSLIFIALSVVDASLLNRNTSKPVLGIQRRLSTATGKVNIAEKDRARAQAMMHADRFDKLCNSIFITNSDVAGFYTAEVGVGSPPTTYTLAVDTGSSNTWVGANQSYTPTLASHDTGNTVRILYGSANMSGEEWTDRVTLSPELVIASQSIGVANSSYGLAPLDGILGVGPVDLTNGTVSDTITVPTVPDNLLSQGTISKEVLGIYFVPAAEQNSGGELMFGSYDESVITELVHYVPLTTAPLASSYWGINQTIRYGDETILALTSGIVDTGFTLTLIASDAFEKYKSATGAQDDPITGLLYVTPEQYAKLDTLKFKIGSKSYDLTPNAQIWPRSLNAAVGGNSTSIYLIVGSIGGPSGTNNNIDFVIGYAFLERYYSVFDTENKRVGFASTAYTRSTSN